ncbi:hypothetical protein RHMOL_Rhmol11G0184200 [Rhododendron molle]|uniref:Uncharacterized protein n=1 Tax=Rhododendron molle TaxID=49168 RepID=A0ACC0LTL7_RHOML|nr:hypothetical protein RHMOL_Rhmol11G0184200 [Rhododendron molle]
MKRKRGKKKGKSKKPVVVVKEQTQNVISLNTEDNSGTGNVDNDELDSGKEVESLETPSSTDQPEKLASINSERLVTRPAANLVYGRVKVKIKTSKALDSQLSDAPTQSDTDKSSQQGGLEKRVVVSEKVEDSANSLPDVNPCVSGNQSKKSGGIKIKSSKGFASPVIDPCGNFPVVQSEQTHQKDPGLLRRGPRYNEQELNASLEVIKKIMKMDAAEPFNAPVNPVALGIPDYFDVIDTPMDFGTIRNNLESGAKYMNSRDVFKDVQYIWENCFKYNNKGDYIVDLMKRVKKNLMKYWTAAGLYAEQPQGIDVGIESNQSKDVAPTSNSNMQVKGGHFKHKMRKRHGVKRHKDDCLCAICVMMRRRQEREESAQIEDHLQTSSSHVAQEMKPEEPSPAESPYGEDTSSNMNNSPGPDADADLEERGEEVKLEGTEQLYGPNPLREKLEVEKGTEMEIQTKGGGEISGQSQPSERSEEEHSRGYPTPTVESGGDMHVDVPIGETPMQHENVNAAIEQQRLKELSVKKQQKAKMYENLHRFENPILLKLCETVFPDGRKSVWSGPHSLARHQDLGRSSLIHEAVATFMK